jgi:inosine-uridine nucleoside N-ribohydrolase
MASNVVIIVDPGIDGAFAVALALHDPDLNVLALAATAGNVSAEQATRNVHILVEQMDPPRWPRIGAALPIKFDVDGTHLHGPGGLGGVSFPCSELHHPHPADKLIVDMVNQHPKEVTLVCMGPATVLARALDRAPDLPSQVKRLVVLGGAVEEPGNAGPVSEFHFYCDPLSARQVLRSGAPITLIPLDVMRRVLFSPSDLLDLPAKESRTCRFLRQIVPYGIGATSNLYGLEGFHLKDVLGVIAVALPGALSTKRATVDVETRGELTRGMSVVDRRTHVAAEPNVDLAVGVDGAAVRSYIDQVLRLTERPCRD